MGQTFGFRKSEWHIWVPGPKSSFKLHFKSQTKRKLNRNNSCFFYCCAGWGYIVAFTKVLNSVLNISTWIHLSTLSFILPFLIPGVVSTGIIFAFTYMCTQYLHCIHPPIPFPCHLSTPTAINPPTPGPVLPSCSSYRRKEKNDVFAYWR
jgi:hypothetical protein